MSTKEINALKRRICQLEQQLFICLRFMEFQLEIPTRVQYEQLTCVRCGRSPKNWPDQSSQCVHTDCPHGYGPDEDPPHA